MSKQRALLLLSLCFAIPAQAGLLEDDDARKQIQQLEARVLKLEDDTNKQLEARVLKLEEAVKQQARSMLDLQGQIEALNTEMRKLHGQNEETLHGLQEAEKRQKDFYVDLDTRMRHFESAEEAAKEAAAKAAANPADSSDPVPADRAYEAAYGLFKAGSHANAVKAFQDFLKKYPDSEHVPNAVYWLGSAQLAMKDYQGALDTFQGMLKDFADTPKTAEVLLGVAGCQQGLKLPVAAHKTLKQIIVKYPTSEAAAKAKKQLAAAK